jgi:hypothetical protein
MSPKSTFATAAIAALGTTFLMPTSASAWPHGFNVHEAAFARPAFQDSGNPAKGSVTAAAPLRTIPTVIGPNRPDGAAHSFRPVLLTPKGSGNTASGGGATIKPIGPGGPNTGGGVKFGGSAISTNLTKVVGTLAGTTNSSKVSGTLADGITVQPPVTLPPPPVPSPPVNVTPTPPAPPVTTGQGNSTPPAPCTNNCGLPGVVGVSVGGGIVVVQGDTQASPSPRPRDRQNDHSSATQNGIASNVVHTNSYQAIALAWNDNGSWVIRKAGSLEDANKIALSICNTQYGTCVLSNIAVKPTSYACMVLGHSSVDEKNLVAATRGTLEEARSAVLEALGAPGNTKLIVYSDCSA